VAAKLALARSARISRNLLRTGAIGQEARVPEAGPSASPLAEFGTGH